MTTRKDGFVAPDCPEFETTAGRAREAAMLAEHPKLVAALERHRVFLRVLRGNIERDIGATAPERTRNTIVNEIDDFQTKEADHA
jgi:hypothetical protein